VPSAPAVSSALPLFDRTPADAADEAPGRDATPQKLDGRRTHIIDRALDYVALAEQGLSASRIARKRRKSQGYVSIALRLGRAIVGMEPGELAALRSPRVTWKLAQRIVREDADAVSIRHQLRTALGGFSTHNLDARKHRKGRGAAGSAASASPRAIGVAWGWDATWFGRDPVGFAEAHLRYLGGAHQSVQGRATRAAAANGVDRVSVGQGIRTLQRSLAAGHAGSTALTPEQRRALAVLEILERKLAEARAEVAALLQSPGAGIAGAGIANAGTANAGTTSAAPDRHAAHRSRPFAGAPQRLAPTQPADDDGLADALEAELRD
jgi:hypothetical protein